MKEEKLPTEDYPREITSAARFLHFFHTVGDRIIGYSFSVLQTLSTVVKPDRTSPLLKRERNEEHAMSES
jgi:hypothetical protein